MSRVMPRRLSLAQRQRARGRLVLSVRTSGGTMVFAGGVTIMFLHREMKGLCHPDRLGGEDDEPKSC